MSEAVEREAVEWRITVEYDTYEQAKLAASMLRPTMPRTYVFDALDRNRVPVWHERGSLHYRPERDA